MNISPGSLYKFFPQTVVSFLEEMEIVTNCFAYFVGGSVRDAILERIPNDFDIEIFAIFPDELTNYLKRKKIEFKLAGNNFPVWTMNIDGFEVQISLPRKERARTISYKDFEISIDPFMTVYEASERRDFTMNSLYMSTDFVIIDSHGGIQHLEERILVPTSPAFKEDPLRVFRAMRFLSEFNLKPSSTLIEYSKELLPFVNSLEKDVIAREWLKWSKTSFPHLGMKFLVECGWISLYPELEILSHIQQNPIYHPEGNVWNHTLLVLANVGILDEKNPALTFAALLHDTGKSVATSILNGEISSIGHEEFSAEFSLEFFNRIHPEAFKKLSVEVYELCLHHMAFHRIDEISKRTLRRKSSKLKYTTLSVLTRLICCDILGRELHDEQLDVAVATVVSLNNCCRSLEDEGISNAKTIVRVVDGDFLISKGLKTGPLFGKILADALELQLQEVLNFENREEWWQENAKNY